MSNMLITDYSKKKPISHLSKKECLLRNTNEYGLGHHKFFDETKSYFVYCPEEDCDFAEERDDIGDLRCPVCIRERRGINYCTCEKKFELEMKELEERRKMEENKPTYEIEIAKTDRAKCKKCQKQINKDERKIIKNEDYRGSPRRVSYCMLCGFRILKKELENVFSVMTKINIDDFKNCKPVKEKEVVYVYDPNSKKELF